MAHLGQDLEGGVTEAVEGYNGVQEDERNGGWSVGWIIRIFDEARIKTWIVEIWLKPHCSKDTVDFVIPMFCTCVFGSLT